jgi:hypothetical protein
MEEYVGSQEGRQCITKCAVSLFSIGQGADRHIKSSLKSLFWSTLEAQLGFFFFLLAEKRPAM